MILIQVPLCDGTTTQEHIYNINDYPWKTVKTGITGVNKKKKYYYNVPAAFDIETTTLPGIKNPDGSYAVPPKGFMYQWQFCIDKYVCMGRTFEELLIFFQRLQDEFSLDEHNILTVYVHNLSYEFQFIKDFFNFDHIFCKDKRKVMYASKGGLTFKCSYFLSNMSLAKFCENSEGCRYYKLSDTYDYKKMRTPDTPLTREELSYCYNDVRGLCECIAALLKEDDITTIPLTNTGYVRRAFRRAMNTPANRRNFQKIALFPEQYKLLRKTFRGGNTHASRFFSGQIVSNVKSKDKASSYPGNLATDYFPMGKFMWVTLDTQEKLDYYTSNFCVAMEVEFFDISTEDPIPYIPISHCNHHSNIKNDNGRVLSADYISMCITELDLDIIRRNYDYSMLNVKRAMYCRRGQLPIEFIETLMEFYNQKTQLKDVDGKEYEYMKSKNRVNSSFGMTVTALDHSEIEYHDHEWSEIIPELEEALQSYYKGRNNFLSYQWGVWCTAHARHDLQDGIDIVGKDIIYTDTDSVKHKGDYENEFQKLNKKIIAIDNNNHIKAYAVDKNGKKHYLGVWDDDGAYIRFKTLGAKKYCYESYEKDGTIGFHITVSGMHKKKGAKAVGSIENFTIGTTFTDVGRTTSHYTEEDIHQITVDGCTFTTASGIGIVDTTYTLGVTDEYYELINEYFYDYA